MPLKAGRALPDWAILLGLAVLLFSPLSAAAEPLAAPEDLVVEREELFFEGRWTPVAGASRYEVWVNRFGRWSFNPKDDDTSPLTSSFKLPVTDERALFRVRAVNAQGEPGEFSDEAAPVRKKKTGRTDSSLSSGTVVAPPVSDFDPKAPAPEAPTGLFAIWSEPSTIKLVWHESAGAKNYSVEEFKDDRWTAIATIEFPKPSTAIIKNHPAPGPYRFRVRAVGKNGRASEPSRPTTALR